MLTTIDLPDAHLAALLEVAARREKTLSDLVQEAIAAYLEQHTRGREHIQRALALRGVLQGEEAERLREATEQAREDWR